MFVSKTLYFGRVSISDLEGNVMNRILQATPWTVKSSALMAGTRQNGPYGVARSAGAGFAFRAYTADTNSTLPRNTHGALGSKTPLVARGDYWARRSQVPTGR
jgi:hypothetical protein